MTKHKLTIDELVANGRVYFGDLQPAVYCYVYLDGYVAGTMWVEPNDDAGQGYFETCFDGHWKNPERLEKLIGPGRADDQLAPHILKKIA
jgi:hypothetical protein